MSTLCYHAVDPEWDSRLAVTPEAFWRHCRWLTASRRVIPLAEAVQRLDRTFRLPRGLAALTFDDGYESLYHYALPIVRQLRLPITIFLVAETLSPQGRDVDWIDPPPRVAPRTLSLEQILEMQEAGVSFESHSWSHADLPSLSEEACLRDLSASRALLEDLLKRPVRFLAYPRGRHAEHVRRSAARAGYTASFSLPERREPVTAQSVPRVGVYRRNGVVSLALKSARWYLPIRTSASFNAFRRRARHDWRAGRRSR